MRSAAAYVPGASMSGAGLIVVTVGLALFFLVLWGLCKWFDRSIEQDRIKWEKEMEQMRAEWRKPAAPPVVHPLDRIDWTDERRYK